MAIAAGLVADLRAALSPAALVTAADELVAAGRDWWAQRGVPGVVVRAASAADVAATLRYTARHGVAVVPRAAGTNVSAGFLPTPEALLLDLRTLDRVVAIDQERREAVVGPGVINGALNRELAPLGLCFSPDPASAAFSTIGGNLAENAGGPRCLKYGVTVHHVNGIECALVGGDLLRLGAGDAGPDLLGVLIGSEGTLGIITEATLALRPLPPVTCTLLAIFDDAEAAAEAVSATIAAGVIPAALEYCDGSAAAMFEAYAPAGYPTDAAAILLVDLDGESDDVMQDLVATEAILRRGAREVRRADDEATSAGLWRGRLQGAQALIASGGGYFICDTTVPRERIPAMQRAVTAIAARHGLLIPTLGHAGDGNIHPIILFDQADPARRAAMVAAEQEITAAAVALGGTITGEHGVGSDKVRDMARRFAPAELAALRAVKAAFDPAGLLNPGILLPPATAEEPTLPRFAAAAHAAVLARRDGDGPQRHRDAERDEERSGDSASRQDKPGDAADGIVLDAENLTVTAPAGTTLTALRATLAARRFSVELPDTTATLGATLGDASARAAVRAALLAVRATLPEGPEVRFGSNAVKDVAGYDLKRLYIGSGATFGTVREATLKITPVGRQ